MDEQLRLAHRYHNTLIEVERERRQAAAEAMSRGEVVQWDTQITQIQDELAALRRVVKAERAQTRRRSRGDTERAKDLRQRLRVARGKRREALRSLRDDLAFAEDMARINGAARERIRLERARCGVYWGTYLQVERAVEATRDTPDVPHFHRWDGSGAVAVQLQKGVGTEAVLSCQDTRVQLDLTPLSIPGRKGKARPRLRLRIGSTPERQPIWAEWPLIYHRPLPEGARVKWVKVVRTRVATDLHWSVHVTLELADLPLCPTAPLERVVAVDLGWKRIESHGGLTTRAGGWTDGEGSHDIVVDPAVLGMLDKVADLRSIRDQHRDRMRATLVAWRDQQRDLPEPHAEQLGNVGQWRAPARFAALAWWWRGHRVEHDEALYEQLEAWRKQDKHLYHWEAYARRRAIGRRREQYRVLAAQLARTYGTLVLEKLDLRRLAQIPKPDEDRDSNAQARAQRTQTAPSSLRQALVEAFRARGGRVVEVPPQASPEALWRTWCEQGGDEKKPGPARSKRFKRMRGIADTEETVQSA